MVNIVQWNQPRITVAAVMWLKRNRSLMLPVKQLQQHLQVEGEVARR